MLDLTFANRDEPLSVLCLGAHADDIEIGCGGTMLELARHGNVKRCDWVVLSSDALRADEAHASASAFLEHWPEIDVRVASFRESYFPYLGSSIKEYFDELAARVTPDIVLVPRRDDLHQDHRSVGELAWNTFRNHVLLEYDIPKYDGELGPTNLYVPIDHDTCKRKIQLLSTHFASQSNRHWFSDETFWAVLRLRGVECRSPSGYAEGFVARKLRLGAMRA